MRKNKGRVERALMEVLEQITNDGQTTIDDLKSGTVVKALHEQFRKVASSDLHHQGFRVQRMFCYVAASLNQVELVKEEDAGFFFSNEKLSVPDLRLVLRDGQHLLVEVKNFNGDVLKRAISFKKSYVDQLLAYAATMGPQLRLAIYWRRAGMWSIIPATALSAKNERLEISFTEAMLHSEMVDLGDVWLGVEPPLSLVFLNGLKSKVDESGTALFQVEDYKLFNRGREITDDFEQSLAWFLMMYGEWESSQELLTGDDGSVLGLAFTCQPVGETDETQSFAGIGQMSRLISNQFRIHTSRENRILRIAPASQAHELGIRIPEGYRGEALKLWRMQVHPCDREHVLDPVEPSS